MHATTAPDPAAQFAAKILDAKRDAVDALHKLMSRLTADLDAAQGPEGREDHAGASIQRLRLYFQVARELLRVKPPADPSDDPDSGTATHRPVGTPDRARSASPRNPRSASAPASPDDEERLRERRSPLPQTASAAPRPGHDVYRSQHVLQGRLQLENDLHAALTPQPTAPDQSEHSDGGRLKRASKPDAPTSG